MKKFRNVLAILIVATLFLIVIVFFVLNFRKPSISEYFSSKPEVDWVLVWDKDSIKVTFRNKDNITLSDISQKVKFILAETIN